MHLENSSHIFEVGKVNNIIEYYKTDLVYLQNN